MNSRKRIEEMGRRLGEWMIIKARDDAYIMSPCFQIQEALHPG